ncbi:MAG: peptidoglycan-binding domain-containing protein [Minisyncoccia bacterium]
MSRKLVSAALAATTLVWAVGIAALPVANAQSTASLQAQIQALLAQISQLQSQMGTSSTQTTTTSSYSFTKDLTLGSSGADVTALQQLLISKGSLTAVSAPTGYFGALTQKALASWQAANGIAPAVGYFGPKTRAFVNSMSVGSSSTTTGGQTTTTTNTTSVTAPASGVAVSVASTNPATGSLISSTGSGAARVPVLAVNFTAGNSGAVTVSEVKFHKVGVLSDSSVSGAYLTQNGQVLYQYNSLSGGVLDFSGMSLNIPAGQTVTLTLAIDISSGLSAGNTTAFSLNAASDVTAWDASNNALTPSGIFPVSGNQFTVTSVSNPSLATLSITKGSIGGTVTAGTQGNLIYASTFNVGNSKVWLEGLNFHVIGSANKGDIRNVKLVINGTQVGATLPTVNQDGTAYFNAAAAPGVLNTGNNNVQVFADVMGSPSYNFTFEVLNGYDVLALDSQYNVPVKANSDSGNSVTIQQGQITVTQDPATPSGTSLSKGQAGVVLAKFDIYAAGESVRILYLPFQITFGNATTSALTNEIQNVQIVDDAGGQVGTTINLPDGTTDIANAVATYTGGVYTSSFGTASSPINYTIPANTTRVLSLKADIQSTADFTNVQAGLNSVVAPSFNLQGVISSQTTQSSAATGNTLTLSSSELTVTQDSSLGSQTLAANTIQQKIGSYSFTASQSEGVTVSNVTVGVGTLVGSGNLANLRVIVNGTQFGSTQPTVTYSGTANTYNFSGTPFTVPAGGTVVVGVYADVLSNAVGNLGVVTNLNNFSGTGATSYTAVSLVGGAVQGQNLNINSTGPALTESVNTSYQPANDQMSMSTQGNILASFNLNETANVENVKLTSLNIVDVASTTNSVPTFSNLTLWNGAQEVGSVQSYSQKTTVGTSLASSTVFLYPFTNLLNNALGTAYIPRNGVLSLTLKGDVNSFTSGNAADNSTHMFEIATSTAVSSATSTIVAQGATSGKSATIVITNGAGGIAPGATTQTVLRNVLAFSSVPVGATSGRGKSTNDEIADLTFNAPSGGSLYLNNATITFQGTAASTSANTFIGGVKLLDPSGNSIATSSYNNTCNTTGICSVTFNFSNRLINSAQTYKLIVNDALEAIGGGNNSVSLYATVNANTDVVYTDATDGTGLQTTLPSILQPGNVIFPLNMNSVTYSQGT